jgi:hypothetical protein
MQLIGKKIFWAGGISLLALLTQIHFVRSSERQLALAPWGYNYAGRPLTGIVFDTFSKLNLSRLEFIFNGKREGISIQWFENGQRSIERHYAHGLETGVHKAWYEDGSVRSLKTFAEGLPNGEFFEWHSNGTLAQYVVYDHGRELRAKSWTAGGKPFYNYVWRDQARIGLEGDRFCSPKRLN